MNSKISNLGDFRMYKVIFSPVNDSIPVFFKLFLTNNPDSIANYK